MRAESIEQIREHLERGGEVRGVNVWGHSEKVVSVNERNQMIFFNPGFCEFDHRDIDHWELLPIEEEENLPLHCDYEAEHHAMQWRSRIRTALLYGRKPEMQDLLQWWQATTGERIEHGERCTVCECSGQTCTGWMTLGNPPKPQMQTCPACKGSGYTVRPTWMEASGDE